MFQSFEVDSRYIYKWIIIFFQGRITLHNLWSCDKLGTVQWRSISDDLISRKMSQIPTRRHFSRIVYNVILRVYVHIHTSFIDANRLTRLSLIEIRLSQSIAFRHWHCPWIDYACTRARFIRFLIVLDVSKYSRMFAMTSRERCTFAWTPAAWLWSAVVHYSHRSWTLASTLWQITH